MKTICDIPNTYGKNISKAQMKIWWYSCIKDGNTGRIEKGA